MQHCVSRLSEGATAVLGLGTGLGKTLAARESPPVGCRPRCAPSPGRVPLGSSAAAQEGGGRKTMVDFFLGRLWSERYVLF